ncbi:uncharacterized protein [Amphiura filiformis]|uniref:uncharacterized protein n=1 Tax=Amphiura filiformis TaxID=82378 RepID=UPI003B224146
MNNYIILLLIGVFVALGAALPFFANEHRDFKGAPAFDNDGIRAPADQTILQVSYHSSSASDYDSTPSDGGGDTNPTPPTDPPGGNPTQPSDDSNSAILLTSAGGITLGVILGLALAVGIAVAIAIFVIKKKG